MSLYEYSLFSIYNQFTNGKISSDELEDLPENIIDDLNGYLRYVKESYEIFIERCFYKSIKLKHFIFTKYFLSQVADNNIIEIINQGLRYVKDSESVDFLIKFGANDWDQGLLGSTYNNDIDMIKYFIKLGANDFDNAMLQAIILYLA